MTCYRCKYRHREPVANDRVIGNVYPPDDRATISTGWEKATWTLGCDKVIALTVAHHTDVWFGPWWENEAATYAPIRELCAVMFSGGKSSSFDERICRSLNPHPV